MNNNSGIITRVDESTKHLMEKVQSGLTDGLSEQMQEVVRDGIKGLKDDTENIVLKLGKFNGLQSSIDELKQLAEDSKRLLLEDSPIDKEMDSLKTELISKIDEKGKDIASQENANKENLLSRLNGGLDDVKSSSQKEFLQLKEQVENLQTSVEKVQLTLDIIVNLVTPFWKRKFVEEKQKEIQDNK